MPTEASGFCVRCKRDVAVLVSSTKSPHWFRARCKECGYAWIDSFSTEKKEDDTQAEA